MDLNFRAFRAKAVHVCMNDKIPTPVKPDTNTLPDVRICYKCDKRANALLARNSLPLRQPVLRRAAPCPDSFDTGNLPVLLCLHISRARRRNVRLIGTWKL